MSDRFKSRRDAGRLLAAELKSFRGDKTIVLGLPDGGVPVGVEIARLLACDFDVFIVRQMSVQHREEPAFRAGAAAAVDFLDENSLKRLRLDGEALGEIEENERREIARRERIFRSNLPPLDLCEKNVVLVDDGLHSPDAMFAAVTAVRTQRPASLAVAVPVASPAAADFFRRQKQLRFICLLAPREFVSIGEFYRDFSPPDEIKELRAGPRPLA